MRLHMMLSDVLWVLLSVNTQFGQETALVCTCGGTHCEPGWLSPVTLSLTPELPQERAVCTSLQHGCEGALDAMMARLYRAALPITVCLTTCVDDPLLEREQNAAPTGLFAPRRVSR